MTDVWGDPSQNFEVEDFSHFEFHRSERKQLCTRNSGGIIIYVRNNLVSEETLFAKRDDTHTNYLTSITTYFCVYVITRLHLLVDKA